MANKEMKMSEVEAAGEEPPVAENPLADLVDAALAKDYNKANEIFGQAITVKLDDVMDQERIRLSNAIYNASDEEDEEDEDMEDSEDVSDDDMDVEDSDDEGDMDDGDGDDLGDEEAAEESVEVEN